MLLTPRLLSVAFAVVLVFASPYVAGTQSTQPPAPRTGVPAGPKPGVPSAPAGPAPQAGAPPATGRGAVGQSAGPPTQVAGQPAPKPAGPLPAAAPAPAAAAAQAPIAVPPPAAAPAPAVVSGPQLEPQGYTYDPAGRRDPFVSLVRRGTDTQKSTIGARGVGLAGLETSEVTLKGTIASEGGFVGIVQGVDNKTYIVRAGDRLLDGTIRAITQDSMVITQQVTDPLSLEKQREVRKVLRQTEEAK